MKIMLTLFTLALLSSFALTTDLSLQTENALTTGTSQNFILNLLRTNESIHSRNNKFKLTMKENCNLVLKEVKGKVLYRTGITGKFVGCKAVLRGNSNFEIISDRKSILWTTRTSFKHSGSATYKLHVTNLGNIMVKNKQGKCVWGLYGCPIPKKMIKNIQKIPAKKALTLIKRFTKLIQKRLKVLPTKQLPLAKNKPIIKKQTPVVFKAVKPKPIKSPVAIKKATFKKFLSNKTTGIRKIINKIRKFTPQKQIKKLMKLVKSGASYVVLKKKAVDSIQKRYKKFISKEKKILPKKKIILKTKKAIKNTLMKTSWMKIIKNSIKRGLRFKPIKKLLKTTVNVRGNKKMWKKIKRAVKSKNFNKVAKIVSTPIKKKIKVPKISNKKNKLNRRYSLNFPAKKRWVLRYRTYLTFYWRYYYNYNYWVSHCWGRWWWRRCYWCRHATWSWYQHWYWTGYYYWSYE